jgi:hypothetical protein
MPGPGIQGIALQPALPYLTTPLFTYDVLGGKQTTHHNMVGYRYAWDKKRVHRPERKGSRPAIEQELLNETARAIESEQPNKPNRNLYQPSLPSIPSGSPSDPAILEIPAIPASKTSLTTPFNRGNLNT